MFDFVYEALRRIGYTHPIHPTEVHMPIGLVVGALIFAVVALLFHRQKMTMTPRHCIILAFIWIFPTMLLGYMDWQHYYGGAMLFPIKVKLIAAPVLMLLLLAAIFLGHKYGSTSMKVLPLYFLCFCTVVVLGYFGGQLVYGGRPIHVPEEFKGGEKVYAANCAACHPGGGNLIDPGKPIMHSPLLKDLQVFVEWLRHPAEPMPAFPASKITDDQAQELYRYIVQVLEKRPKEGATRSTASTSKGESRK